MFWVSLLREFSDGRQRIAFFATRTGRPNGTQAVPASPPGAHRLQNWNQRAGTAGDLQVTLPVLALLLRWPHPPLQPLTDGLEMTEVDCEKPRPGLGSATSGRGQVSPHVWDSGLLICHSEMTKVSFLPPSQFLRKPNEINYERILNINLLRAGWPQKKSWRALERGDLYW